MAKIKKIKVDTIEAIATAIVAYRANNNRVVREGYGNNKEIIYTYFTTEMGMVGIEDARAQAVVIRDALSQRVMMNTLTGARNSDFLNEVARLLQADTVSSDKFGLLAWAPKLYDDMAKSDDARELVLSMGINSEFVGKVGKKIELVYEEINCRFLPIWNSYAHIGHDGQGNLVMFFKQDRIPAGGKITARVKSHKTDERLGNSKITVLNYVKVL